VGANLRRIFRTGHEPPRERWQFLIRISLPALAAKFSVTGTSYLSMRFNFRHLFSKARILKMYMTTMMRGMTKKRFCGNKYQAGTISAMRVKQ
jgi:hypothetical protein